MRVFFTTIFLLIFAGLCVGEPSNPTEKSRPSLGTGDSTDQNSRKQPEPHLPIDLDLSDETIETLFLAAYLNLKLVAEIIEAQQKDGRVYFNVGGIAALVESPFPEDAKKWATAEWLAKTYPAKFIYLDRLQALSIEGEGELPIEKRLERERIHKYLSAGEPLGDIPELKFDYDLFHLPAIDFSATYTGGDHSRFLYSFNAVSEALYGTARLLGRGLDDEELTDLRFSWERVEPSWSLRLGDVFTPSQELLVRAETGRGFVVSNIPRERSTQFDTETIEGDLQVGWEVELYRGNVLLDFRKDDGTGRFRFEDIPLLIGDNDVTLKYYGPQGQVQEVSRPINIGNEMATPGRWLTRFGVIDQGENLFLGRNSQTRPRAEGILGFGEVSHGLTKALTFKSSLTSVVDQDRRKTFVKVGLRGAYFGASERLDLMVDETEGKAVQFGFLRRLYGVGLRYDHVEFGDFETDLEPNLVRRDKVKVSGRVGRVFLEGSAETEIDTFKITRYEYKGRATGYISQVTLSNEIQANFGGTDDRVRGKLLISGRPKPKVRLRSALAYDFEPQARLSSINEKLDYRYSEDLTLRLDVIQHFTNQDEFRVSAGFLWNTPMAGWGLTGTYSTVNDFRLVASVTFSLSPDASDQYYVHRKPNANIARVDTRVFLDRNQDGIYNSDQDELLESVKLEKQNELSGKDGIVSIRRPPHHVIRVKVNEETLPDPYFISSPPTVIRPRAGRITKVDIPVWETGEIEGTARPGEPVKLINKHGDLLAVTHAEFDGFYLFEKVHFGTYNIRYGGLLKRVEISQKHPIGRVK